MGCCVLSDCAVSHNLDGLVGNMKKNTLALVMSLFAPFVTIYGVIFLIINAFNVVVEAYYFSIAIPIVIFVSLVMYNKLRN